MAWYRNGTVAVTNGSATVTGAGTDFVSNVKIGEIFVGPDRGSYEVAAIVSATQLTLAEPYQGPGGGGQGYKIAPTSSFARDLALAFSGFKNTFGGILDTIGQGMFSDGTVAAPGIRFASDQDTGLMKAASNALAIVTGGQERGRFDANGRFGIGTPNPLSQLHVNVVGANAAYATIGNTANGGTMLGVSDAGLSQVMTYAGGGIAFGNYNGGGGVSEYARFDASGNLLVGVASATAHVFSKPVAEYAELLIVQSTVTAARSLQVQSVAQTGYSTAGAALYVGRNSTTGRSMNAGGTINASGADYAEYMLKSNGCGPIAKGDVCGVDADGRLTKSWAAAKSFVVKSTDPAYVGGDSWADRLPPKPEEPGSAPIAPTAPGPMPSGDDADVAGWQAEIAAYPSVLAAYQRTHAAWEAASDAYAADLPVWEADLEQARQTVDRIAFAGQVPVNIAGDFAVGDYLIAAAKGAGIQAVAVAEADITFDQYRRRLGKVWAIRKGRPWIDVQHG